MMTSPDRRPGRKPRAGFTLIELLVVLIIIGIAIGVATPAIVRSLRNQRLHSAAHTLVTVSRYARSMAIVKQCELALSFNLDSGQIDLISSNSVLPRFTRAVENVRLNYVETEDDGQVTKGTCTIPYYRNGTCRPFAVMIHDRLNNYVIVKVDALSTAKTIEQKVE